MIGRPPYHLNDNGKQGSTRCGCEDVVDPHIIGKVQFSAEEAVPYIAAYYTNKNIHKYAWAIVVHYCSSYPSGYGTYQADD